MAAVYADKPYRNNPRRLAASGGRGEGDTHPTRRRSKPRAVSTLSVTLMQRTPNPHALLLAAAVAFATTHALAAPIVVSTPEDWNGVLNPHEADGVTLSGSGAPGDPAVYTIPDGLVIQSTGAIRLTADLNDDTDNANITFLFAAGDLQIEEGGYLETSLGNRSDTRIFTLDLGGGSITGAGRIVGLRDGGDRNKKPRGLAIQNVRNVELNEIDLHVENVSSEIQEDLKITATGQVRIQGVVNYSDTDNGGNLVRAVRIDAESIEVGGVDTRALRGGPPGRPSGEVVLRALSAAGNYDPAFAGNQFANRVTVNGVIRTDGNGPGGNVTFQGAVLQVGGSFALQLGTGATAALQAGLDTLGAPRSDLLVDAAGAGLAPLVAFAVAWDGVAAPGAAPAFASDPVLRPRALPNTPYVGTLVGTATDPDGNPLTFARGHGPAWLIVAPSGDLSGTPTETDSGMNTWTISVSDGTRTDVALLRIGVSGRPTFFTDPVVKPNGFQNQPYAHTLADVAADPDGDPITFAKVNGPAWLNVAANGALSGTPPATATSTNTWTVSVADPTGSDTATLIIVVGGSPRWLSDPIAKSVARAGADYADAKQTLAADAVDPEGDPIQFAKVSGPAWLQVASDGALSGTPTGADVGEQTWVVRASDATGGNTAALKIQTIEQSGALEIAGLEVWDGVQNPHAGEGVVLSGSGTVDDPAVYTIPTGLRFTPTGAIHLTTAGGPDNSIKFVVGSGKNIDMAAGSYINVARLQRSELQTFVLDLGGGSLTGAGQIFGIQIRDDSPRQLTIENAKDVTLQAIDLHVVNANNGNRNLAITASGTVSIPWIDISDQDTGGNQVGSVIVKAENILVGSIDTRSMRNSNYRGNGNIELTALGAPAYDPGAVTDNDFANRIVVNGQLRSRGPVEPPSPGADGNILLQGVGIALNSAVAPEVPDGSSVTVNVGTIRGGATAADLFADASGSATAQNVAEWSGLARAPSAPSLLSVDVFAATALRLAWSAPDLLATEFLIEQSPDGAAFTQVASVSGGARHAEIGNLAANRTYYFRLKARNAVGASAYSGIGSAATPAWGLNVNFADAAFTTGEPGYPILGYLDDYGAEFGDRGNGQSYGWAVDNSANDRLRDALISPDRRYDTLTHLQRGGDMVWEAAVASGMYRVRLVAGDPTATDSTFQFDVEGLVTAARTPALPSAYWREFVLECPVTDGRLTIRSGPQAANNKLCFVDIVQLAAQEPPKITSVALSGGDLTLQWTGGGALQGTASLTTPNWIELGTGGSWTEPASGPAKFYRVRR